MQQAPFSYMDFANQRPFKIVDVYFGETHPELSNIDNTIVQMRVQFPHSDDQLIKASIRSWMQTLRLEFFFALTCYIKDNSMIID
jgi:hypothetical protein